MKTTYRKTSDTTAASRRRKTTRKAVGTDAEANPILLCTPNKDAINPFTFETKISERSVEIREFNDSVVSDQKTRGWTSGRPICVERRTRAREVSIICATLNKEYRGDQTLDGVVKLLDGRLAEITGQPHSIQIV